MSSNPITREEHGPILEAAMREAQAIHEECLRAGRCKIDVRRHQADIEDAIAFLQNFKAEYLPDEET